MRPAALLFLAAACGGDVREPGRVERTDSAGITIVSNTGGDRPLDWRFERVSSIGAISGPQALASVSDAGIAVGPRGRLYVLDHGNHRVSIFEGGTLVRSLGGAGEGPGELARFTYGLDVAPNGVIAVYDAMKRSIVRWDSAGNVLQPWRVPYPLHGLGLDLRGDGFIIAVRNVDASTDAGSYRLLRIGTADTVQLAMMPAPETKPVDFGCVRMSGMPRLFEPDLIWAAAGDRIFVNRTARYEIRVMDEVGEPRMFGRRDLPPREATAELAALAVGDSMRVSFGSGGGCSIPQEKVVEVRGFAPVVPIIRRLAIAPDGGLWVERGIGEEEHRTIDVFSPDGSYVGTLPDGTPFPAAFRDAEHPIVVERDELDVQYVVTYEIGRADFDPREVGE